MKTRTKFILLFFIVSFAGALSLRWLALEFLYHQMGDFWSGIGTTVLATVVLGIIIGILTGRRLRVLEHTVEKAKSGQQPSQEERRRALDVYRVVNAIIIGANVVSFFIGQLVVMILDVTNQVVPYRLSCVTIIMIQATLVGAMAAQIEIYALNNMMASDRRQLGLHSISEFGAAKSLSISGKLTIASTAALLFMGVNAFSSAYGLLAFPETLTGREPISQYLRFGAESILYSLAVGAVLIRLITGEMKGRIAATSKSIRELGEGGDLKARIAMAMNDDLGVVTSDFNGFVDQLGRLIAELRGKTQEVAESARGLSASASGSESAMVEIHRTMAEIEREEDAQNQLIQDASDEIRLISESTATIEDHVTVQMESLEQSSASVRQMAASIASVAEMSRKTNSASEELLRRSEQGAKSIASAIASIREIQEVSKEVEAIVKLIQDIAGRTNLLSMNAAIEAAHAGAAGRGFAIVAEEVRNLAASSAKSATAINTHISDMIAKIDRGVASINEAGASFTDIGGSIAESAALVRSITEAMEEQRISASETEHSSVALVEASHAIRELTKKQRSYADAMNGAVRELVKAAEKIAEALGQNRDSAANLDQAIGKMQGSIVENDRAVRVIEKDISIFKL